ncbi:inverse autotransporter beta domain-containing protein [Aeromonas veronii]
MSKLNQPSCRIKKVAAWVLLSLYTSTGIVSPIAAASTVLKRDVQLLPYSVVAGDTLYAIALRHGLTVDGLLELNKRAPKPINSELIKVGQIIYVPAEQSHVLPALNNLKPEHANTNQTEAFIAGQASRLGQTYGQNDDQDLRFKGLKNGDTRYGANKQNGSDSPSFAQQEADYLKQQVQSAFQAEANQRVKNLLVGFGTAEVELAFDDDFRLRKYSADVLAPLVDTPERLLFVQAGGRHDDTTDRTIVNLGVGQRHFFEEWMLGYNAFLDYDILRHHSRLGLGAEAWADHLKLSANVYTPLSNWKDSPDFDEYLERAARGFDLNAKYYLPKYPQLGISAKVEQYFGDEVDLVGSKQLERNPYAGTVGLEWQPVPLLKVGVDYREAKGNQSDTQINVGLEWTLGASLDEMLNPANVALSRQLQGMRHDLVERNNNIVLEYKEKDRAVTVEHAAIAGMSGELVQLNPIVNISKGNIVSWLWSSPEPLQQGALSNANTQAPTLTLPILPLDVLIDREFTLYLTVTDERGRTYQSSPISVVVRVNPEMLTKRLIVISEGHEADSIDSPHAEVLIEDQGTLIEFVLARQLKTDASSSVIVEAREVVFDQLAGYDVEQLEGEFRGGARNADPVWVNKLKVTPRDPGQPSVPEVLSFHARGAAEQASGNVHLTLKTSTAVDHVAKPQVSNLRMAGKLEVGQNLTATYAFDANGGDTNDHSTYAWGNQGETAAAVPAGQTVATSGVVPGHTLVAADVGEVKEVSVQAKNGLAITGNTVTVDAQGNASDSNGGTGGGGSDTTGGTDTDGDGKGDTVIDPADIKVRVIFTSTATEVLNGAGANGRPVANTDVMTAECQVAGEPAYATCDGRFDLQWYANGMPVIGATMVTYTPGSAEQGQEVTVEAILKP